jgi:cytochrome c biogenesis protein
MSAVIEPLSRPPARAVWREVLDLLASMRFAITLLTVICIASTIGTILKQGEPLVGYVDAFGPFWTEVFGALGLFRVYSSGWFLVILAFLVASTSLCIARNTPKILADLRTFKEHLRVRALDAFHHKAQGDLPVGLAQAEGHVQQWLQSLGWQVKSETRSQATEKEPAGVMVAARRGAANKLGYIAAHSAIVLVCVGGLLDGDLVVNVQAWWSQLQPFRNGENPSDKAVLSLNNPAYRAQLYVPEGQANGQAVVNVEKGMLVQPLPFDVQLKKFIVEYYDTGMPKRFASEIVVQDLDDKSRHEAVVEVNKPFTYKGVTLFQSSFQDGGSEVKLKPVALQGGRIDGEAVLTGIVGGRGIPLPAQAMGGQPMTLEVGELRVINVEDLGRAEPQGSNKAAGTDPRGVNLEGLSQQLGSGAHKGGKKLTNIGPSITYKLRDSAGQAREFQNYMVPVRLNDLPVFLLGVRNSMQEGFRFLRVPADENMTLQGWLVMRNALFDEAMRAQASQRFAKGAAPADKPELQQQLATSAQRVLDIFAGLQFDPKVKNEGGLVGLGQFIERVVPPAEQERASATMIQMLNGSILAMTELSREKAGLPALNMAETRDQNFMQQAVLALSDAMAYPVPVVFTLDSFEQKQASVFQATRTPGRNLVYLGCVLLIVGVFAMLYVRERRVWVWLQAAPDGQTTQLKMALSSTRQTLDTDAEFDRLRQAILPVQEKGLA